MSLFGRTIVHSGAKRAGFDIRLGFALARDPNTPRRAKMLAAVIGLVATVTMIALEVPLEAVFGLFVPVIGEVVDLAFDGLELIALPLLIAAGVLPMIVRPKLVRRSQTPMESPPRRLT